MKTAIKDISIKKKNGRFYTPAFIVRNILDLSGYCGDRILKKHVIDNSCGDGAFLKEIVKRYCEAAIDTGLSAEEIAAQLSTYVHGIEIDGAETQKCVDGVNAVINLYGVAEVNWDIVRGDALKIKKYDGKMDYVLGNPPYIRVHNAGSSVVKLKQFAFAKSGMTDLYLAFYEVGIKMLNGSGVLGYINPSSLFTSIAGSTLRKYFTEKKCVEKIVDLRHYQAFEATTYSAIVILNNAHDSEAVQYFRYDEDKRQPYFVEQLQPQNFCIDGKFYFSERENLRLLYNINANTRTCGITVKNGYATLSDEVFIGVFEFKSRYIIPVIKSSTGKTASAIYPYDESGKLFPESVIKQDDAVYRYLLKNKPVLLKRSTEKGNNSSWYSFGRSQAIKDTYKQKIALNNIVRTSEDLRPLSVPAGVGVYGGLYVLSGNADGERIAEALKSEEFLTYVSLLGKYKSGGYYTFSSKDVEAYLNYKLS